MAISISYLAIIFGFLIYYILVLFIEKKVISDPKQILEKFLSTVLLFAGISLVFFSLTGKPFLGDSPETYTIYIFIIGFISILWTIPNLLQEFSFFKRFTRKRKN
jgi:hypothetical protein